VRVRQGAQFAAAGHRSPPGPRSSSLVMVIPA
jgi:hypothetical protein